VRWANQGEIEADRKGLTNDRKILEQLKIADLLTRFKDTVIPNRRGKAVETFVLNAFLKQDLAQTRLSVLTPDQFAAYRDERLETVRPGTINRELGKRLQHNDIIVLIEALQ
jgi:hypothetical protein